MKINVISFLDPRQYSGGGEAVTRALLQFGLEQGYDFRIASARPHQRHLFSSPDVTLAVDLMNGGHTFKSLGAWRHFPQKWLADQLSKAPYVHLTNAYADLCRLPYLPCGGGGCGDACTFIEQQSPPRRVLTRTWANTCSAKWQTTQSLYRKAALNVFVSPLHAQTTWQLLGAGPRPPEFILRPIIDTTHFRNLHGARDIDYLFVGVISKAKGLSEMRERFGDRLHLAGQVYPGTRLDFGTYLGPVPYERMPALMNRARNFVFLPEWPEPQGRVAVEASLCGCTVIANENVGAMSFNLDLSDPVSIQGAESEFWGAINALIGDARD